MINYRYSVNFTTGTGSRLEAMTETMVEEINELIQSISSQVETLAKSMGIEDDVVVTGGVAKNKAVFSALSRHLNCKLATLNGFDPQLTGALGAALLAQEISDQSHKVA